MVRFRNRGPDGQPVDPQGPPAGPAAEPRAFPTTDEQLAAQEAPQSTEGPLGTIAAAAAGAVDLVPGGKALQGKILGALGVPEQFTAQKQAQLKEEHTLADIIGMIGAAVAPGAAIGGVLEATTGLGAAAELGAKAATLAPAYKLGEIANQAQLRGEPLNIEQIGHAFSLDDILEAGGLGALMGAPGATLQGLAAAGRTAGRTAVSQAGKTIAKAAAKLGITEEVAGQFVLDNGLLRSADKAKRLAQEAGRNISDAVSNAQIDPEFLEKVAYDLVKLDKMAAGIQSLKAIRQFVRRQAGNFLDAKFDGEKFEKVVQSLGEEARTAYRNGHAKAGEFLGDAQQLLRDHMGEHLSQISPEIGIKYRTGVQDYRTYTNMAKETARGAAKQATLGDIGSAAGRLGVAHLVGETVGGPVGAAVADTSAALLGLQKLRGKQYTVLLDRFSKMTPSASFEQKAQQVLNMLTGSGAGVAEKVAEKESSPERYARVIPALRAAVANPDGVAMKLRAQVNFLPPQLADAVVASQMDKLQCAALTLPPERGPATAFGIQTEPSDRQKREFLRKLDASFDPYGAVASGRPDLVLEAEKYNPETIRELRMRVINQLSSRQDIPYMTKRRVFSILGVAGTPGQDPATGAQLQDILTTKRKAQDQAGEMGSARQANAAMKNDNATLTRAQKLLNSGE